MRTIETLTLVLALAGCECGGTDPALEGVWAWCLHGDACLACEGDIRACGAECIRGGGRFACFDRPDCTAGLIDCPAQIAPDAGTYPADGGMPEMCAGGSECDLPGGADQLCIPGGILEQVEAGVAVRMALLYVLAGESDAPPG
jgi:hypothetical protein